MTCPGNDSDMVKPRSGCPRIWVIPRCSPDSWWSIADRVKAGQAGRACRPEAGVSLGRSSVDSGEPLVVRSVSTQAGGLVIGQGPPDLGWEASDEHPVGHFGDFHD
jgi:hypothetical protein